MHGARVILQGRAAKGKLDKTVYPDLLNLYKTSAVVANRLRAMWTLHITKWIFS